MRELFIKTDGSETITESELKSYLNYQGQDIATLELIRDLGSAARFKIENFLGRNLIQKTMVLNVDDVSTNVQLPMGPIYQVSSVKVYDVEGVLDSTLTADDDYYLLGDFDKWIRLESFFTGGYLSIEYTAGYGANTFTLPDIIKSSILRQAKFDFDHRGATDVPAVLPEVQKTLIAYQCSFL